MHSHSNAPTYQRMRRQRPMTIIQLRVSHYTQHSSDYLTAHHSPAEVYRLVESSSVYPVCWFLYLSIGLCLQREWDACPRPAKPMSRLLCPNFLCLIPTVCIDCLTYSLPRPSTSDRPLDSHISLNLAFPSSNRAHLAIITHLHIGCEALILTHPHCLASLSIAIMTAACLTLFSSP